MKKRAKKYAQVTKEKAEEEPRMDENNWQPMYKVSMTIWATNARVG